jgi:hypothetical protein
VYRDTEATAGARKTQTVNATYQDSAAYAHAGTPRLTLIFGDVTFNDTWTVSLSPVRHQLTYKFSYPVSASTQSRSTTSLSCPTIPSCVILAPRRRLYHRRYGTVQARVANNGLDVRKRARLM